MTTAPLTGAPEWDAAEASPWSDANIARRIFDAFTFRTSVKDRDLTEPPASCSDGDRYLIATGATGKWAGEDGKLAMAVGTNARGGWMFADIEAEGTEVWIEDEAIQIGYYTGAWEVGAGSITSLTDLGDVESGALADGAALRWDASNGMFFGSPDTTGSTGTFRGALVKLSANDTSNTTGTTLTRVNWDAEVYDTDSFHDTVTNNSRFTIPSGVSKVRLSARVAATVNLTGHYHRAIIYKNNSATYDGVADRINDASGGERATYVVSPVLSVSPGDYFEVFYRNEADTTPELIATGSWFQIEVIE